METRGKANAEFRNEVNEILTQYESSFDQVNAALQAILTELQSLHISRSPHKSSHHPDQPYFNNRSHHHLKLSFSKFNGEDPTGWVYKAEQYFDFKKGIALPWHHWFTKFKGPLTWDEFTQVVLQRFGPKNFEDLSEALTRLKQTTTVTTYQETFEKLSHRVDGLPEKFLVGCFIVGLQDKIRLDVKIKQPSTLADTIEVVRLIEEHNQL
ncbi:hypothetical protein ACOSQ3_006292 [Xanthoceras sorbifolium]